jgi:hypothetical protein
MWFGSPERNTLRPRRGLLYCCVFFELVLNWPEWTCPQRDCPNLSSVRPFIAQGRDCHTMTQGLTRGPRSIESPITTAKALNARGRLMMASTTWGMFSPIALPRYAWTPV